MNLRHRRRQKGSVSWMAGIYMVVLMMFLWGTIIIGQMALRKDEHQAQADAWAIGAAAVAMREGVDAVCNHNGLQRLVEGNSTARTQWNCPAPEFIEQPDGSQQVVYRPTMRSEMESTFFGEQMRLPLATQAASTFTQVEFDTVDQRFPKLVLVLDYSGSMEQNFGNGSRIQAQRRAVVDLLDMRLRVEYGLVMFSSDVIRTVAIDRDERQQDIRNAIRRDPGGSTNYSAPIRSATNLLTAQENTGYFILFMTDGYPNAGGGPAGGIEAADRARAQDVTVFTLNVGGIDAARDLLIRMAGPPGHPNARNHAFEANNAEELRRTFRRIVSSIICTIGPLAPVPAADDEVFVFLRDNGRERPLRVTPDLDANADRYGFVYSREENKVRLTQRTCDEVIDNGADIVTRFGSPRLVQ